MSKFISTTEVASRIQNAIDLKTPFCLLRLGDGENSLIGYPEFTQPERLSHVLQRAFGVKHFDESATSSLIHKLRESIKFADIIGVYETTHPNPHCSCGIKQIEYYGLVKQSVDFAEAGINLTLHEIGAYQKFLFGLSNLGIISSRPVAHIFRENFGIKDISFYPIPQEHNFEKVSGDNFVKVNQPHYPNVFNKICKNIQVEPGQLFFVGAGQLGKIYCSLIKSKGGIAIDVGAMFDMWLGLPTRTERFMSRAHRGELMKDYSVKEYSSKVLMKKEEKDIDFLDLFTCFDVSIMLAAGQQDLKTKKGRQQTNVKLMDLYIEIQRIIQPSAFIEIGAINAEFSRCVRKIFPKSDVIAFEENSHNYSLVNKQYNFFDLDIRYENIAFLDKSEEILFPIKNNSEEENRVTVPVATLDNYLTLNGYGAKYISAKIDVERGAGLVIKGAEDCIGKFYSLMIGVNDDAISENQWTSYEIGEYLMRYGFVPIARDFENLSKYNIIYLRKDIFKKSQVKKLIIKFYSGLPFEFDVASQN